MAAAHPQTLKTLRSVKALTKQERQIIADLGLLPDESLVLAQMRSVGRLLIHDASLDAKTRQDVWGKWRKATETALKDALRYRENIPLILAMAAIVALYPCFNPGAMLLGYKTMDDLVRVAERDGYRPKRDRRSRRTRLTDHITRCGLWVDAHGDLLPDRDLAEGEQVADHVFVWGIALDHPKNEETMPLVEAVLPVLWQKESGAAIFIAPQQNIE